MLLSAVSVLVVAQSSSEIPEGLMNNPVFLHKLLATEEIWNWLCININILSVVVSPECMEQSDTKMYYPVHSRMLILQLVLETAAQYEE